MGRRWPASSEGVAAEKPNGYAVAELMVAGRRPAPPRPAGRPGLHPHHSHTQPRLVRPSTATSAVRHGGHLGGHRGRHRGLEVHQPCSSHAPAARRVRRSRRRAGVLARLVEIRPLSLPRDMHARGQRSGSISSSQVPARPCHRPCRRPGSWRLSPQQATHLMTVFFMAPVAVALLH